MKQCKDCKWHFAYMDWRFNGQELWSNKKKKFIIPCHNGNQRGDCENFEQKQWWKFWR